MSIVFIINGASKRAGKVLKALLCIKASGLFQKFEIYQSEYPGHALKLAANACEEFDYLIAVGGDGTLNEVVNGCLHAQDNQPRLQIPILGVLPLGTANDFFKTISGLGTADELLKLIDSKSHREIDVGKIRYRDENGQSRHRYFLNIASVGIGANVVQGVNKSKKTLGADLTFIKAIIKSFLTYKPRALSVKLSEDVDWRGKALILAIANGRYFGSGLCIAPHARIDDGIFGVTLIGSVSVKDFIFRLGQLKKGAMIRHPEVTYHDAKFVEVNSESADCAVEADGEFLGYTPLKIEILPRKISFLVPNETSC